MNRWWEVGEWVDGVVGWKGRRQAEREFMKGRKQGRDGRNETRNSSVEDVI